MAAAATAVSCRQGSCSTVSNCQTASSVICAVIPVAQDIARTECIVQYYRRPPCLSPTCRPQVLRNARRIPSRFPQFAARSRSIPPWPHLLFLLPTTNLAISSSEFCIDPDHLGQSLLLPGRSQRGSIPTSGRSLSKAFPRYAGRTLPASGSNLPIYSSYVRIRCPSKVPARPTLEFQT